MDLLDRPLFSRISVWASEKAVPVRDGGSTVTAAAGRWIFVTSSAVGLASDGDGDDALACRLRDSGILVASAADDELAVAATGLLPSLMEILRSNNGVCLPPRHGESRVNESMDGRPPPEAARICVLDGGRSRGKREKEPPCGGPVDILTDWSASSGPKCGSSLFPCCLPA